MHACAATSQVIQEDYSIQVLLRASPSIILTEPHPILSTSHATCGFKHTMSSPKHVKMASSNESPVSPVGEDATTSSQTGLINTSLETVSPLPSFTSQQRPKLIPASRKLQRLSSILSHNSSSSLQDKATVTTSSSSFLVDTNETSVSQLLRSNFQAEAQGQATTSQSSICVDKLRSSSPTLPIASRKAKAQAEATTSSSSFIVDTSQSSYSLLSRPSLQAKS